MPFAGYPDFDSCVKANSDKRDPEAYCGKIKHQVEDEMEVSSVDRVYIDNLLGQIGRLEDDLSEYRYEDGRYVDGAPMDVVIGKERVIAQLYKRISEIRSKSMEVDEMAKKKEGIPKANKTLTDIERELTSIVTRGTWYNYKESESKSGSEMMDFGRGTWWTNDMGQFIFMDDFPKLFTLTGQDYHKTVLTIEIALDMLRDGWQKSTEVPRGVVLSFRMEMESGRQLRDPKTWYYCPNCSKVVVTSGDPVDPSGNYSCSWCDWYGKGNELIARPEPYDYWHNEMSEMEISKDEIKRIASDEKERMWDPEMLVDLLVRDGQITESDRDTWELEAEDWILRHGTSDKMARRFYLKWDFNTPNELVGGYEMEKGNVEQGYRDAPGYAGEKPGEQIVDGDYIATWEPDTGYGGGLWIVRGGRFYPDEIAGKFLGRSEASAFMGKMAMMRKPVGRRQDGSGPHGRGMGPGGGRADGSGMLEVAIGVQNDRFGGIVNKKGNVFWFQCENCGYEWEWDPDDSSICPKCGNKVSTIVDSPKTVGVQNEMSLEETAIALCAMYDDYLGGDNSVVGYMDMYINSLYNVDLALQKKIEWFVSTPSQSADTYKKVVLEIKSHYNLWDKYSRYELGNKEYGVESAERDAIAIATKMEEGLSQMFNMLLIYTSGWGMELPDPTLLTISNEVDTTIQVVAYGNGTYDVELHKAKDKYFENYDETTLVNSGSFDQALSAVKRVLQG